MGGKKRGVKRAAPKGAASSNTTGELYEQQLRAAYFVALSKQKSGKALSATDFRAMRRYEEHQEEKLFWRHAARLSQKELVELLGSPKKVLIEWEHAGMPRNGGRGSTYDLKACLQWWKDRLRKAPLDGSAKLGADSDARRKWARAQMDELKLLAEQGKLVEASAVRREYQELVSRLTQRLGSVPSKVAAQLEGKTAAECGEIVRRAIEEPLEDLASRYGG